jgi:spermidine/putrescine transport system permease protein
MVKAGSTPVLNAVSVFLMLGSATLALIAVIVQRERPAKT